MRNILIVYDGDGRITSIDLLREWSASFSAQFDTVFRFSHVPSLTGSDLAWADVLFMARCTTPYAASVAELAKGKDLTVIAYYDDDLLSPPSTVNYSLRRVRRKAMLRILRLADVLLGSNAYLLEKYQRVSGVRRVVHMESAVTEPEILVRAGIAQEDDTGGDSVWNPIESRIPWRTYVRGGGAESDAINLVYAGGHTEWFREFILGALMRLDDEFGESLSFTFVGVDPGDALQNLKMKISIIGHMPFGEYKEFMRGSDFDIGIAPISDTEFAKCKYYNKFVEYSKYGIFGVYSNLPPYTLIVKNGINGMLTDNSTDAWYGALKEAITNEELRRACVANATTQLKRDFNAEVINRKIAEQIPELVGSATVAGGATCDATRASGVNPVSLKATKLKHYYPFFVFSKAGSVFFYLRRGGIMGLIRHSKAWLRARVYH